jgi:hypothetical protein
MCTRQQVTMQGRVHATERINLLTANQRFTSKYLTTHPDVQYITWSLAGQETQGVRLPSLRYQAHCDSPSQTDQSREWHMTTPTSGMPSQAAVDDILRAYGIAPGVPATAPLNLSDPAVITCAAQRQKADRDGKPVTQVIAVGGDRLTQLFDEYDLLKDQFDALSSRVDDLKDAIKAELHQREPDAVRIQLFRTGRSDGLAFTEESKTYVDSKKLKANYPDVHAQCTYEKAQWGLRRIGSKGQIS